MVYLVAVFFSAITVAQPVGRNPCLPSEFNYHVPEEVYEHGPTVGGAALGAALGYRLAKPPTYSSAQVRQWFKLDQGLLNETYGSIRQVQSTGETLRATYAEYYQHYNRELLRPMIAERIATAQNGFVESLKQLFRILMPDESKVEEIPRGQSELARLVTNHRNHITRSILSDLRQALTQLHEPHQQEAAYLEIADKYVSQLDQALAVFDEQLAAAVSCEVVLSDKFIERRRLLATVLGGAVGGFAGWLSTEVVRDEAMNLTSLLSPPAFCPESTNPPGAPLDITPSLPLAPPQEQPEQKAPNQKTHRSHELDRP